MINNTKAMGGWYWICELKDRNGNFCNAVRKGMDETKEKAEYTYRLHMSVFHNTN